MSTMLWVSGIFFMILGLLRGWNKEIIATAGIVLAAFALFQFDTILRGWLLASAPVEQVFVVEIALFLAVVFIAYRSQSFLGEDATREVGVSGLLTNLLGGIVGFFNGYLVWGVIWYFLDVSQYPFAPLITAPGPNSPSAEFLNAIPLVLVAGGTQGTGDLFAVVVLLLFFLAVFAL